MQKIRLLFETYFRKKAPYLNFETWDHETEKYLCPVTNEYWVDWQAASSAHKDEVKADAS